MSLTESAEELARLRKMMGWTQAELARRLHVTQGYVSMVEAGVKGVEARTVELLRFIIAQEAPGAIRLENLSEADQQWRQRAQQAERELADLKSKLKMMVQIEEADRDRVAALKKAVKARAKPKVKK